MNDFKEYVQESVCGFTVNTSRSQNKIGNMIWLSILCMHTWVESIGSAEGDNLLVKNK